ncbi:MAG: ammonia-forming cytochrome c nitrite reductase subunit c552 [Burkholderiales bacterium]|jgi:formate-dependent nitrite reductase cytochrome c552 subunit|nr:ammonia-forming cytochrome c nitrite reductase subunit c552 [Burkholderiales bacterium]
MKSSLMGLWRYVVLAAALSLLAFVSPAAMAQKSKNVNTAQCYACHQPIKAFHEGNKHKAVNCVSCHDKLTEHLADASARPVTKTDPAVCGSCHKQQFDSQYKMDWEQDARAEKSLYSGPTPNPAFDKILMPHGFTKEHSLPRSHAFMMYDQFTVDRSFGGRFQPKDGWKDYARNAGNFNVWDVLEDTHPEDQTHKAFKPGYAAAANPVCISCKTQDHILDWQYMGDPAPNAKWSRLSNVVELAKSVQHSLNCFMCHDPHSAQPRIVRDALIQAITRPDPDKTNLFHKDPNAAKIDVKEMGVRGFTRKIAILDHYDTQLQCGQCHVEYNCNPGVDSESGEAITMKDQRTNFFSFVNVWDLAKTYKDLKFVDFKHKITGAPLWKGQHPDAETFYGSKHQVAGVRCSDCHMPKMKDPKTGKTFTSHWTVSPKNYIKETCLTCHKDWNEKQAVYVIDAMKNHYMGKMRKNEFWLTRLIDKIEQAKLMGVDAAAIKEAQAAHSEAHVYWEWWSAANAGYFHNHQMAIDSINYGMDVSQKAIDKLDKAMADAAASRVASSPAPAAAAAPAK